MNRLKIHDSKYKTNYVDLVEKGETEFETVFKHEAISFRNAVQAKFKGQGLTTSGKKEDINGTTRYVVTANIKNKEVVS